MGTLKTSGALAVLGITAALTIVACSGTATGEIADFTEIAVTEPVMTPDPSGTTAVLTVETSVEAVCAVAYGDTEELGSLATDLDMGGGGHSDHSARLVGLEPDTEYFYRLQGVGPDGTLYQGDLMTFRTPVAVEADGGGNAALGATVVEVSSEFSASFAAGNAVDGDLTTEWSSAGDGDDAFIVIDLGRETEIAELRFTTRSMGDGSSRTSTYTVTIDGGQTLGPYEADMLEPVNFSGQLLRFEVDSSTGGNTGAIEIEVFAAS